MESRGLPNVAYSEDVVDVSKRVVRWLRALEPPARLRLAYEAYVHAEEEVERLAEDALEASVADDGGAYFKARKLGTPVRSSGPTWRKRSACGGAAPIRFFRERPAREGRGRSPHGFGA